MYEIYEKLLLIKGLTTADVCRATGISQSTMSNWKKRGNDLSAKNAQKVADFLDVSVDYLMSGKETTKGWYLNEETAELAQELFENPDYKMLFDAARGSDPESMKLAADMLIRMKKTNPDG